jgi:hypothetical protein
MLNRTDAGTCRYDPAYGPRGIVGIYLQRLVLMV